MTESLDPDVYDHLRRLARRIQSEMGNSPVPATGLVHEAWEKLARGEAKWADRPHFLALCARAMRQILIDAARARNSQKRGGARRRTTLAGLAGSGVSVDLIALEQALDKLEAMDSSAADVVVLRTFGGLTMEEIAAELGCSRRTAQHRWAFGRAFLLTELDAEPS